MAKSGPPSVSARYKRLYKDAPEDNRNPPQRDRDRILYTSAFARLAEVTQVVSADEGHVFHNRLTHSIKVAQVGRRLAEKLLREKPKIVEAIGGLNPDVVEAACLAHDLGHPPFGHVAEEELDKLVRREGLSDGFEGNAQSFRIVNKLAMRSFKPGLNLTRATLNAILKYPWLRRAQGKCSKKWGAYNSERREFRWARKLSGRKSLRRSAEAELMDWADDVTYAVHDVADFFRAGLIPLDRLCSTRDDSERGRFFNAVFKRYPQPEKSLAYSRTSLEQAFVVLTKYFPFDERYRGTELHRAQLRFQCAGLIRTYVHAVKINKPTKAEEPFVKIDSECQREVFMLKQLTWHYVILNPSLTTQQYGQRKIIHDLFEIFEKAARRRSKHSIFPHAFSEQLEETSSKRERVRIVADFIAGMTEQQALRLHARLTGKSLGSILEYI